MTILTAEEITDLTSDIREIIEDVELSTTISYKLSGSTVSDWDPTDGIIPDMYTTSSVSAFKGSYNLKDMEAAQGLIELGDTKFIIMTSDVSGILSVDDMIVESASSIQSATTYQIKETKYDPYKLVYFLQSRAI
ncbi:MAG TPA: hypothetical protein ENI18_08550 [Candidatus Aminicenantes bacterium]|nr:hypothetical protein [Candidatus Aminicenantes bacterium]